MELIDTDREETKKSDLDYVKRGLSNFQLWGGNMPNFGVTTTPLLEVFSVSVRPFDSSSDSDSFGCEIYGTIKVTNGLGHAFDIYNRNRDNPELITHTTSSTPKFLNLTGPKDGRLIIPYEYVIVDVLLRDKTRDDIVIAQGELSLDYKNSFYTEHGVKDIGFVTLHYATFPYAVVATVEVVYFSKYDGYDTIDYDPDEYENDYAVYDSSAYRNGDSAADVYGTVATHTSFHGSSSYDIDNASILLDLSRDQCVRVKSRSFIELSRSVVAVPVHSKNCPLHVHVNFTYSDGSKVADGVLPFFAGESDELAKKDIVGENGRIRVRVKWDHAYEQRYRGSDLKPIHVTEAEAEELIKRYELPRSRAERPIHLLEVFSFGIGSNDLQPPFKIYGTITLPFYPLFSRDESSPQISNDNKLEVKYCSKYAMWALDDFGFCVDIRDVETDFRVKGQCAWPTRVLKPWFDKRVCSFIQGNHGYVAVHFTVIYEGLQAQFNIFLKRININDTLNLSSSKLYGSIVAQYSNHDYSNPYDEKYYRSVLFESNSDDPINLNEDGLLPLSKSLVCVPKMSSLIIKANLTVVGVDVDVLQGIVEYNVDGGPSSKEICGQKHSVNISVNWPPL